MLRAEFERHVAEDGWPEFVARQTLEAMVSRLDLSVAIISSTVLPIVADAPVACRALGTEVAVGSLIGTIDTTTVTTVERPQFEFRMEGRIHQEGETDSNTWRVYGKPDLHLRNDNVPTRFVTCSTMMNRIVEVIKAAPGLVSLDMLATPSHQSHLMI